MTRRKVGAGRERVACPRCGRTVTVRRDGGLMAHRDTAGRQCARPAWQTGARREQRCADCGEPGALTGHMECQYPRDHS